MTEEKGRGTQESEQLKCLITKIQGAISIIVIINKNEDYMGTRLPQGAFPDFKVTPDIDGFTDKTLVSCDVEFIEYTFIDYTK